MKWTIQKCIPCRDVQRRSLHISHESLIIHFGSDCGLLSQNGRPLYAGDRGADAHAGINKQLCSGGEEELWGHSFNSLLCVLYTRHYLLLLWWVCAELITTMGIWGNQINILVYQIWLMDGYYASKTLPLLIWNINRCLYWLIDCYLNTSVPLIRTWGRWASSFFELPVLICM